MRVYTSQFSEQTSPPMCHASDNSVTSQGTTTPTVPLPPSRLSSAYGLHDTRSGTANAQSDLLGRKNHKHFNHLENITSAASNRPNSFGLLISPPRIQAEQDPTVGP